MGLFYFKSLSDVSIVAYKSMLYVFHPQKFDIKRIETFKCLLYSCNHRLDIMNIETGKIINSFDISNDRFPSKLRIDSKGDL